MFIKNKKSNFRNFFYETLIDGIIQEKTHLYYIRVHYEDTDIGGIVYHAKYINYIERARDRKSVV